MNELKHNIILKDIDKYYRLAYYYVKNQQDANDIIQESLYKALKNENQILNGNAIKTWFYRIVVNTSLDYIKKYKNLVSIDDTNVMFLKEEDETLQTDLREAVEHLSFKYKTVIVLRYFEDMKISDIAEILDENENTIKSRIYKALEKLKIELKEVI